MSSASSGRRGSTRMLLAVTAGVPVVILLMLLAFLAPAINSGAEDLPLAVAAPAEQREQLTAGLEAAAPGSFDVTVVDDADAVTRAVQDRHAIGGIAASADGIEVVTASGAGSPYAALLKNLATGLQAQAQQQAGAAAATAAQAQGADETQMQVAQAQARAAAADSVEVVDVAPLASGDPTGAGLTSIGLPLVFGGMASAVLLAIVLTAAPWKRVIAAVSIAAAGALIATVVLQPWFGAVDGGFWLTWAGLTAGIAAICLTLIGLHAVAGYAGFALGAVVMMFVSNPLSGLATGPQWLPRGWGALGQMLPVGAAGTWLRSAAYFDGRGMGLAPWVLLGWILAGLLLVAVGAWRGRSRAENRHDGGRVEVEEATTAGEPSTAREGAGEAEGAETVAPSAGV